MKLNFGFLVLWFAVGLAQIKMLDCDEDVIQTEDCAEVISPIACYNQFKWNAQTLTCIEGTDAEKKAKVRYSLLAASLRQA